MEDSVSGGSGTTEGSGPQDGTHEQRDGEERTGTPKKRPMSIEKARKLGEEILTKLYAEADPPCPFPLKKGDSYTNHYLSAKRQEEITDNLLKKSRLSSFYKKAVRFTVFDLSPTTAK